MKLVDQLAWSMKLRPRNRQTLLNKVEGENPLLKVVVLHTGTMT